MKEMLLLILLYSPLYPETKVYMEDLARSWEHHQIIELPSVVNIYDH